MAISSLTAYLASGSAEDWEVVYGTLVQIVVITALGGLVHNVVYVEDDQKSGRFALDGVNCREDCHVGMFIAVWWLVTYFIFVQI